MRGNRFYDEGEDVWPKRYAIWGRLVAKQPNQVAYAIIDSKSKDLFMPTVFSATVSESLDDMAQQLGLPGDEFLATVRDFNAACQDGDFFPPSLMGLKQTV